MVVSGQSFAAPRATALRKSIHIYPTTPIPTNLTRLRITKRFHRSKHASFRLSSSLAARAASLKRAIPAAFSLASLRPSRRRIRRPCRLAEPRPVESCRSAVKVLCRLFRRRMSRRRKSLGRRRVRGSGVSVLLQRLR